jgi:hypothetical protein
MSNANSSLEIRDLLTLYTEQWNQIRHLDDLDFRMMALLPIIVGVLTVGVKIVESSDTRIPQYVLFVIAVLVIGISSAGCYTTFRNWLCYMRRLAILNSLEREMGLLELKIIEQSRQFNVPTDYISFTKRLVLSIRFPLTLFYSLIGGCGLILYYQIVDTRGVLAALALSACIFLYANTVTYFSFKKEFGLIIQKAGNGS